MQTTVGIGVGLFRLAFDEVAFLFVVGVVDGSAYWLKPVAMAYYKNMTFTELRGSDEDLSIRGLLFPHPEDAQRVG